MTLESSTSRRWDALKESLRARLSPQAYATWIPQIQYLSDDGQVLRLGLPDHFSLNWVTDHYRHFFEEGLIDGRLEFTLAVPASDESSSPSPGAVANAPFALPAIDATSSVDVPDGQAASLRLNPRYLFSNFVVAPANELAWSAAQSIVDKRASYCPLVIVGGVGLGKTHLLHAIGHALLKKRPQPKVQLKTSEQFINEVVQGIRNQRMEEVRRSYRACDVLLIDDIQFISGKEVCQEEFFHSFNSLYDAQKHIVVTSDRLPHEISDIHERLRTRFAWGLVADLKLPDLDTRVAILKQKAHGDGIALDSEVAEYIAQAVRTNIRDLEGCLIRVHAFASLTRQSLTLPLAKEALRGLVAEKSRTITCDVIVKSVASAFDVKVSDLKSQKRGKTVALPRQIAMYLCRRHTSSSYPEIGQALGGKDHTTALAAFNRITERLGDPEIKARIEEIEKVLFE